MGNIFFTHPVVAETHSITLGNVGHTRSQSVFLLSRPSPSDAQPTLEPLSHILFSLSSSSPLPSPLPPVLALSLLYLPPCTVYPGPLTPVVPLTSNRPVPITVYTVVGSIDKPCNRGHRKPYSKWKDDIYPLPTLIWSVGCLKSQVSSIYVVASIVDIAKYPKSFPNSDLSFHLVSTESVTFTESIYHWKTGLARYWHSTAGQPLKEPLWLRWIFLALYQTGCDIWCEMRFYQDGRMVYE